MQPIVTNGWDGPRLRLTEDDIMGAWGRKWDLITVQDSPTEATLYYDATITGYSQGLYDITCRRLMHLIRGRNVDEDAFDNLWR